MDNTIYSTRVQAPTPFKGPSSDIRTTDEADGSPNDFGSPDDGGPEDADDFSVGKGSKTKIPKINKKYPSLFSSPLTMSAPFLKNGNNGSSLVKPRPSTSPSSPYKSIALKIP